MDETTAVDRSVEMTRGGVRGRKGPAIIPYRVQGGTGLSSPAICEEKVVHIRQQLAENKYDFDRRLDAAFDKLLDELFGQEDATRSLAVS